MTRLIALLILGAASTAFAQQENDEEEEPKIYVELPTGLTHRLARDDGRLTARLPVTAVRDADLSTLTIELFDVQFETTRPTSAVSAFEVSLQLADGQRGAALLIETQVGVALRPGAYTLVVHIASATDSAAFQSVALVMQKVAPTLSTGSTVVARYTESFLFLDDQETEPGTLLLREESRQSDVMGIELRAVPDQENSKPTRARLDLPPSTFDIEAGRSVTIEIAPTEAFPLGTSKGKIEVRTPDLSNVTSVNYEVRTRTNPIWIGVIAGFGVLAGWLLRVLLKHYQEKLTARLATSTAVGQLRDAEKRIEDPVFRERIRKLIAALEPSATGKDTAQATQKAKEAIDELKTIEKDFEEARKTEVDEVDALSRAIRQDWSVPTDVQKELQNARSRLDELAGTVVHNNLTDAKKRREAIVGTELLRAVNAGRLWRVAVGGYFAELVANPLPLAEPPRASLAKVAEALAQDPLPPLPGLTTLKVAEDDLLITHNRYSQAHDAFGHLAVRMQAFLEWGLGALKATSTELERLKQVTDSQFLVLAAQLEDPGQSMNEPRKASRLIQDAWLDVMGAHVPGTDVSKIRELMTGGKWTEAITTAAKAAAEEDGTPLSGETSAPGMAPAPGEAWEGVIASPPARAGAMGLPIEGTPQERALLQRKIDQASFLQSFIVGFLFILGLYYLHAENWVGHYKEVLTVLSLAFLTDLTADGVMKALKP